jgi:hypothetical protein
MRRTAVILACLVAGASTAQADDRADAQALFRVGEAAFNAAHYGDAAEAFEQAYAKLALPAIAFSTAQAHRLQYFVDNQPAHLARAVALYHVYIDQQKEGGRIADAVANLGTIEPLLHQLQASGVAMGSAASAPKTRLIVSTDAPRARATIDGESGPVPYAREVTPGEHAVTIEAEGFVPYSGKVLAVDGIMVPVERDLAPKSARLAVAKAPSGARVSIDGRSAGEPSAAGFELPAGPHLIVITARGRVPLARDLSFDRGQTIALDAPLATTRQRRAARYTLIGGGVLAVLGGVEALSARSADHDASQLYTQSITTGGLAGGDLATYNQRRADRDNDVHASEVFAGAAVAALVTGAALYWFDDPREPESVHSIAPVAPMVGPKSAGVMLGGQF